VTTGGAGRRVDQTSPQTGLHSVPPVAKFATAAVYRAAAAVAAAAVRANCWRPNGGLPLPTLCCCADQEQGGFVAGLRATTGGPAIALPSEEALASCWFHILSDSSRSYHFHAHTWPDFARSCCLECCLPFARRLGIQPPPMADGHRPPWVRCASVVMREAASNSGHSAPSSASRFNSYLLGPQRVRLLSTIASPQPKLAV